MAAEDFAIYGMFALLSCIAFVVTGHGFMQSFVHLTRRVVARASPRSAWIRELLAVVARNPDLVTFLATVFLTILFAPVLIAAVPDDLLAGPQVPDWYKWIWLVIGIPSMAWGIGWGVLDGLTRPAGWLVPASQPDPTRCCAGACRCRCP